MKAARIHAYGGLEVLAYEDAPRPTPAEGEVLIRVRATSVNPFDCYVHAGYAKTYFNYDLPLIPGSDVSGVIEEVGSGVTNFRVGDPVYARAGVWRDGAHAEFVVALASDVAAKPQSLDHQHAAALPHVAITAWQALVETAKVEKDQTVLVHGAAGGVGHVAVQIAASRGAKVIGTASRNLDLLKELGVAEAIDYSTTRFENVVRDVDVVLDLVGGETQERSWGTLKPGGILISTVQQPSEETAASHRVRQHFVASTPPPGETLAQVAKLVDAGQLKPVVSTVLPLEQIQTAHRLLESRHTRGKVVLQVAS